MKNSITTQTEIERRTQLINDPQFRSMCADTAKQMGITAGQWNDNKAAILMTMANEFCAIENANA